MLEKKYIPGYDGVKSPDHTLLLLLEELKIELYCLALTMARARVRPDGDGTEQRVIGTAVAGDHTSRDTESGWARSLRAFYARRRNKSASP